MNDKIKNLFVGLGGDFHVKESKWYNKHAYMPLFLYSTKLDYKESVIKIKYEYRQSEFSKSNILNTSTELQDRHLGKITVIFTPRGDVKSFSISFLNAFALLFSRKKVKIKGSKLLKSKLLALPVLSEISNLVSNSSEFDPLIEGGRRENGYEINCNFNSSVAPIVHIDLLVVLLKEIIDLLRA